MEINKPHIISKPTPGVNDRSRVNVFVDGRFSFSFNLAQVVDFKLKIGKRLSDEELKKCKKASEFGKLYQRAMEWALTRPHSEKEARDYLKRKRTKREITNRQIVKNREKKREAEYNNLNTYDSQWENLPENEAYRNKRFPVGQIYKDNKNDYDDDTGFFSNAPRYRRARLPNKELPIFTDEDIEAVIAKLKEKKYLDDERFARFYLENRNVTKGASVKKLRQDLSRKGIDRKLIDQLMSENIRDDTEEIQKIIAKKRKKYTDYQLIAYLVRQGFDYQLSRDAVAEKDSQNQL